MQNNNRFEVDESNVSRQNSVELGQVVVLKSIRLRKNIERQDIYSYFIFAFFAICLANLMPIIQPFVLSTVLKLNETRQGVVTGDLAFYGEIAALCTISVWGSLSDKLGRKFVNVIGIVLIGVAYILYPYATSLTILIFYRLIFQIGGACLRTFAVSGLADMVESHDKSKATSITGVLSTLGAMLAAFFLAHIPTICTNNGMSEKVAGELVFLVAACICFFVLMVILFGFTYSKPPDYFIPWGTVAATMKTKPFSSKVKDVFLTVKEGIDAGINDPVLMFGFWGGFVLDVAVLNQFLSLWIHHQMTQVNDSTGAEATAKAGIFIGIGNGSALLVAPLWGILCDRYSRVFVLTLCCLITAVGCLIMMSITDPTSPPAYAAIFFFGVGQMGAVISQTSLTAHHCPPRRNGAVAGLVGFFVGCGILFNSKLGGYLYDHWRESGPFVVMGLVNACYFVYGVIIFMRFGPRPIPPHLNGETSPLLLPPQSPITVPNYF